MRKKAPLTVERKNGKGGVSILPLWNPLKTTKKRADAPFLDHSRSLVCAKINFKSIKRDADAYLTDQRDSRNTLRLSRLPYVKYSTGANITTHVVYRALRKPNLTVARQGVP